MEHFCHEHKLILNAKYTARQGDVCFCCREEIVSCKSYIYSCILSSTTGTSTALVDKKCAKFLLHQACANLPDKIENPNNPKEFLVLRYNPRKHPTLFQRENWLPGDNCHCNICDIQILYGYCNSDFKFCLCLKCAMLQAKELTITHKAHPQHSLALIHRPSSFKCDACNVEENIRDMSYRCKTCPFWIHKNCADAPNLLFLFQSLHDHPLILSYGRPQRYHTYYQQCRLCDENIGQLDWFYKCRDQCTFVAHFHCTRLRSIDKTYDSNLVHFPAADESFLNLLVEQFMKSMVVNFREEDPYEHWSHEHPLKLITYSELNNQKDDDRTLLLCDGCVKPIRRDDNQFYSCVLCKFFLHRVCAGIHSGSANGILPKGKSDRVQICRPPYKFYDCDLCGVYSNGIFFFAYDSPWYQIHTGCVNLPKTIKHEAHRHQLHRGFSSDRACNVCGIWSKKRLKYGCEQCDFYICQGCNMKVKTVTHPWDPHPLYLRYDASMVMNHDYEFNCEFCSEEINTNFWFYHCSDCDLSFHPGYCFEKSSYRYYSNVKFGHTNIIKTRFHPHSLTFVLNKKVRSCGSCGREQLGKPVLECPPCKVILCAECAVYYY